jgi:hypothetical protein
MAWLTTLLAVMRAIPDLISLIKETVKWVHELGDLIEKKQAMGDLKAAVKLAIQTGDTSKLDALFGSEDEKTTPPAA